MQFIIENAKRVLVLTAHADDCEIFAGGLVALFAEAGAEIVEIIATDNGRGSFELSSAEVVSQSRNREAKAAAEILGKKDVIFLGHPDGYLDDTPKNELRRVYIEWIRKIRPDVLLSFDPFASFETHPDHIHVARAAVEAVGFAHLPLYHPEQIEAGLETHLTPHNIWFAKNDALSNTIIDVSTVIDKKLASVLAHESQMKMMVEDMRRSLLATGKHQELLPLLDSENYQPAIELLIRTWAANVGKREGMDFGEAYRLESAGDLFDQALED